MDTPSYKTNKTSASNSAYIKRQSVWERQYAEVYRNWTDSMTNAERQDLKALKLDKHHISYVVKGTGKQDAAEWSSASYETDYAAIIDGETESELEPRAELNASDAVRHLFAELMTRGNIRLTVECMSFVFGLWTHQGQSLTEIANRNEVSTEAVSQRCIALCNKFGAPVPGGMHPKNGKDSEKTSNKRKQ